MEEFFILKCPDFNPEFSSRINSINQKIKIKFVEKFNNDGLQLNILDEESEDDIYNYTMHMDNNFCGSEEMSEYLKRSILGEDNFALIKLLNVVEVHSIITFKVILNYLYIDAYCVNKIKHHRGAGILLDYLVHICKNVGINEIRLDSLLSDETINFYIKKGFRKITSNYTMSKIIDGGYSNKKKNKNKKYFSKKIKNKNKKSTTRKNKKIKN